jgi:hypothetical protein
MLLKCAHESAPDHASLLYHYFLLLPYIELCFAFHHDICPLPCFLTLSLHDHQQRQDHQRTPGTSYLSISALNTYEHVQVRQSMPWLPGPNSSLRAHRDVDDADAPYRSRNEYQYLWNTAQQGETYVVGKESQGSRSERIKLTIQAVHRQISSPSATNHQGHQAQNATHKRYNADLNGVGQQFAGQHTPR